jgi:hypothetical protein
MGIYRYLKDKGIVPVIPLDDQSKPATTATEATSEPTPAETADTTPAEPTTTPMASQKSVSPRPRIEMYPDLTFEPDGTPLCPGGCRMRHEWYDRRKAAHIFACPCMRKNHAGTRIFHADECPFGKDCTPPEKKMGYTRYIKSEADLRLLPPIPRNSKRFKALFAHRSGTERQNAVADSYQVDHRHRNAPYTLVRLTLVNICKHARVREAERGTPSTPQARRHDVLTRLNLTDVLPN